MAAIEMREKQVNIRMTEEESARLDAVAAHYGLSAAAYVRMIVKREADALIKPPNAKDAILAAAQRYRKLDSGPIPGDYLDHVVVIKGGFDPFEFNFAFEALLKEGKLRRAKADDATKGYLLEGEKAKR